MGESSRFPAVSNRPASMKAKLSHKVVLVVTIPVLFQLMFFSVLFNSIKELDTIQQAQRDTEKLILLNNELRVVQAMNGCYYILLRATEEKQYFDKLNQSIHRNAEIYNQLQEIWKNNPVQSHMLAARIRFQQVALHFLKMLLSQGKAQHMSDIFGPMALSMGKGGLMATFAGGPDPESIKLEQTRAHLMKQFDEIQTELKNILQLSVIASILVSTITGLLFSSSVIRRLQTVAANIRSMENHEGPLEAITGDDEISSLNKSVQETDKLIRQAEEFQAQTARIVAKELKEPIDQLSDSLQELKEDGFESLTSDGKQRLDRSLQEVERLRILTRDLVSLDKISRAGWDLEFAEVNLAETAAIAIDTVKDFATSVHVNITGDLSRVSVKGDASRLQQIALNFLTNAIKFSPRNKTIEVETKVEGMFGKLSVRDHGTGIPEEFQKSIFGKYEQASREDSTEKGGSGLGLAISKKLIEAQQGRMGFSSKLGEGSTFWLMLPLHQEASTTAVPNKGEADFSTKTDPAIENSLSSPRSMQKDEGAISVHPTLWLNGLFLVLLPTLLQLATIAFLWIVIDQIGANVNTFYKTGSIAMRHSAVMDAISRSSQCAVFYNIEHDERLKNNAQDAQRILADRVFEDKNISKGERKAEENAAILEQLAARIIKGQNEIMDAPENAELVDFLGKNRLMELLSIFTQIAVPVQNAVDKENKLVESNTFAKMEMRRSIETIIFASSICTLLGALLLGIFFTRKLAFRVDHIVQNTRHLIEKEPLAQPLPGSDEIAYVDRSFYDAATRLIQLERFKQEIIAITSHEFRTPLTSLLAKVDLIQVGVFGPLNEKGKKIALASRSNIACLIILITNLLDVEKIQSGKTIVQKQNVPLDSIFEKISENVSVIAEKKQLKIGVSSNDLTANLDSARLVQSLTATLTDIIDYAPKGSHISINAETRENTIELTVTAPGSECSRNALNTANARGRLAVDLLRLIIDQHGGTIKIDSGEERLVVSVKLPC